MMVMKFPIKAMLASLLLLQKYHHQGIQIVSVSALTIPQQLPSNRLASSSTTPGTITARRIRTRNNSPPFSWRDIQPTVSYKTPTFVAAVATTRSSDEDFYYNNDNDDYPNGDRNSNNNENISLNEFSRILPTNRLFSSKRSRHHHQQQHQQQRDYPLSIQATVEECQALAKRFDLTQLEQLQAQLTIRPSMAPWFTTSSSNNAVALIVPVEVEGTIQATVTQTCVRSNEHFQVQVEFPFYVLVKPISREAMFDNMEVVMVVDPTNKNNNDDDDDACDHHDATSVSINQKPRKKSKNHRAKQQQRKQQQHRYTLDDILNLQAAREASTLGSTNDHLTTSTGTTIPTLDSHATRAVAATTMVEDPAIYSSTTGILDVGELVAQSFWLQLDPFPKKPGTRPVQMEISG
jgi:hypothetical protein